MFFKSRAQELMEALNNACRGPELKAEDFVEFKRLDDEVTAWAAEHPEEFIPLLTEDNANMIGERLAGSGVRGIALLRKEISRRDSRQRRTALRALWEFDEEAASEVPMLTALLNDDDSKIRARAAHCLGRIGGAGLSAGTELTRLAQEGSDDEKRSAFFALARTGYDPAIVAQIAYDEAEHGSQEIRRYALELLEEIGSDPTPAFDAILRELDAGDKWFPQTTTLALLSGCNFNDGDMGERAIAALERFLSKDPVDAPEAREMLAELRIDGSG